MGFFNVGELQRQMLEPCGTSLIASLLLLKREYLIHHVTVFSLSRMHYIFSGLLQLFHCVIQIHHTECLLLLCEQHISIAIPTLLELLINLLTS